MSPAVRDLFRRIIVRRWNTDIDTSRGRDEDSPSIVVPRSYRFWEISLEIGHRLPDTHATNEPLAGRGRPGTWWPGGMRYFIYAKDALVGSGFVAQESDTECQETNEWLVLFVKRRTPHESCVCVCVGDTEGKNLF